MDNATYEALKQLKRTNSWIFADLDDRTRSNFYDEDCRRKGMHKVIKNNYDNPFRLSDDEWEEWEY